MHFARKIVRLSYTYIHNISRIFQQHAYSFGSSDVMIFPAEKIYLYAHEINTIVSMTFSILNVIGLIAAASPSISSILNIFDPMTLPSAISA